MQGPRDITLSEISPLSKERWQATLKNYVAIARIDHWFKNIFVLPGMMAALIVHPGLRVWSNFFPAALGILSVCLVASSNYVINEILDAPKDRFHPLKCNRPLACGSISVPVAYAEWLLLAAAGIGLGYLISIPFLISVSALWVMGLVYNCPPVRSKDLPYLDVLSEAVNNPLRMLIGWYALGAWTFPPSSFLLSYWMVGSFLMTAKRLAEYRLIGDHELAAKYRSSFKFYSEESLVIAMLAYASGFMFFMAVIIVKYHTELVLACPLLMLYLAYYTKLTYKKNSIVQTPEKLLKDKPLVVFSIGLALVLIALSLSDMPSIGHFLGTGVR